MAATLSFPLSELNQFVVIPPLISGSAPVLLYRIVERAGAAEPVLVHGRITTFGDLNEAKSVAGKIRLLLHV